jgi:glycosyltransferase involved in cell wall biosynthesis
MKVYVFGSGHIYRQYKHILKNFDILGFLDNDAKKIGNKVDGYSIFKPDVLPEKEYDYVILMSVHYEEMRRQLEVIGVPSCKIIDKEHLGKFGKLSYSEQYLMPEEENSRGRVLMFAHALNLTGAPIVFFRLAKTLKKMGYSVTLAAEINSYVQHKVLLSELIENEISVIMVPSFELFDIEKISQDYDFYWVCTILLVNVVKRLLKNNKNIYWWLHESEDTYLENNLKIDIPDTDKLYVLCGGWIAEETFKKYTHKEVYRILMYGMPAIPAIAAIHNKNSKVRFGIIGAYSIRKGYDVLYKAIVKNEDRWKESADFCFVGTMPEEKRIEYGNVENIKILGEMYPAELSAFYETIDVLIMPSLFDPMPVVVTEAMQHKKTCIVTDKVGQSRYIESGVDGVVCNAGDASNLAKAIDWAIENKDALDEIGGKSYEIYERDFSMESFEENVKQLLADTV